MNITLNKIRKAMKGLGYKIYDQPYKLNIVGIRGSETIPNKFDDKIVVFYKDKNGITQFKQYDATTDPGTFYLKNPINNLGTAILKEGQYVDAYQRGNHQGSYLALVQRKPVTVYRDYDRDALFDLNLKQSTGMYGINIHKAGKDSIDVNNWSAGCQVFKRQSDFNEFMNLTEQQANRYGNTFTYTLIDERAIRRRFRRNTIFLLLGLGVLGAGAYYTWKYFIKGK